MALSAEAAMPARSLAERWMGLRNRLIASPRFQRWAAASPLTRHMAKRRAKALFDLCAGFVYSQVLLSCVRLRLFDLLAQGPRDVASLCGPLALGPDAARRLLRAAASLKLIRALPGERYALDDLGAALLGNPSVGDFVEHHALLYADLADPVALLRGEAKTRLSRFWPYAGDRPGGASAAAADGAAEADFAAYGALMSRSQALVAQDILDAYPLRAHRTLLDVGGGEGAFVAAAAARAPRLALQLFDLAPVAARAKARLAAAGLDSRVAVFAGSFLVDALPRGADVIAFVRILHDHDDESALAALRAAYAALPVGGVVLVAEPMSGAPGAEAVGDAYFGFYLLAMGRGRARTPAELASLLAQAGFSSPRAIRTRRPLLTGLIFARRV